jgi:hypothetical protein
MARQERIRRQWWLRHRREIPYIFTLLSHLLVFSAFHLHSEALRDCIIEELDLSLCTNALRKFRGVRRDSMNVATFWLTIIAERLFRQLNINIMPVIALTSKRVAAGIDINEKIARCNWKPGLKRPKRANHEKRAKKCSASSRVKCDLRLFSFQITFLHFCSVLWFLRIFRYRFLTLWAG